MRKSDLIDLLQEIEGDPYVYIEEIDRTLYPIRNIYTDIEGDIIIEK